MSTIETVMPWLWLVGPVAVATIAGLLLSRPICQDDILFERQIPG